MNLPIVVAGGTGKLGRLIIDALLARGAAVRALVRPETDPAKVAVLTQRGVELARVDLADAAALTQACAGAGCVVSALAGLRDVIVDAQSALLDAAVAAGVPRFIPSDFYSDYTQQPAGQNRNFDLRREFQARLDQAPLAATSILNGAFAEVLTYNIPLLNFRQHQVGYWEDADWQIDFTTMADTAAFTAAAALDAAAPRWLRIASFQLSARELVAAAAEAGLGRFELVQLGTRADLAARIAQVRAANPAGEHELYADWQQLQYLRSMFSVQNHPLDNHRYPDLTWTSAPAVLAPAGQAPTGAPVLEAPAGPADAAAYSDEELVKKLPGFTNHYATVNGVQLHYVAGGSGQPLVCLPGWPQTWYSFHPIAPTLAQHYRVIIVDIRGMGSSDKPATGYDKKTMAQDIHALVQHLGLGRVSLLGHDIGGMVASSFAFNYPESTHKLLLADGAHPSAGLRYMSMLPAPGAFTAKMDGHQPYVWWMAFNQVPGLPEKLLAGRFQHLLDYLFAYVMLDERRMSAFDRAVYAAAYNQPESIRAANGWYQALGQDIEDASTYAPLTMPVLGIGSYVSYEFLRQGLPSVAPGAQVIGLPESGHYLFEEKPDQVLAAVLEFLQAE
ncbi:alpha/beta fold hydrolase [Hymenobacter sp. RP-2-7]|uniref:Alpha/beta fold hydrolase n=1 Tax=Hymenobacter polaris TaxID=2682546 RepID=A0A7Y0AAX1_9BACT|nr:alpha/beta fold hydrolase [Hymenobacter polaris]NML63827.1 alpha/beta fold hydrolase [Hymenobacter polaris]